ncbi:MAG TPA: MraY family glycosyltransferase [Nitrospiria bacterium]|nr:MraY family glycosyltransferase [Nitrospiria bacterium]
MANANLLFIFVPALAVSMLLIPLLTRWAERLRIVDEPGERKVHAVPVPRIGGIAFAAGVWTTLLLWAEKSELVIAYLVASGIILAFGVWDDRFGLGYRVKFLGQVLAASAAVGYGHVTLHVLPFTEQVELSPWLAIPLTVLLLVGITNAVNLSDGLDGLAGGLCLLTFGAMAYLSYLSGNQTILILTIAMAGGLLGFLRFNTYPATIFMGDAGSQFLGFTAGFSALLLTNASEGSYTPVLALLMIGLPLLDTLGVIIQRMVKGRSPFLPDRNHLHHKLLTAGFFHHEAVLIIYTLQAVMVGLAYLLQWQSDLVVLAVYGLIALPVLSLFWWAGRVGWRRPDRERSFSVATLRRVIGLKNRWATELPVQLLGLGVFLFLALGVFVPQRIPADFGVMAISLFGLLVLGALLYRKATPWLIRLGLYVGGAFMVYLGDQSTVAGATGPAGLPVHEMLNVFFGLMAVLVVVSIRFNRNRPFQITPLDYLMVLLVVTVPNLPEIQVGGLHLGGLAAKIVVLFFAYELILSRLSERTTQYGLVSLWVFLALGIRAWANL